MHLHAMPLSRPLKKLFMMAADAAMIVVSAVFSLALLDEDFFSQDQRFYTYFLVAVSFSILFFARIGLYRVLLLYMGLQGAVVAVQGVTVATVLAGAAYLLPNPQSPNYSVLPILWMMMLLCVGGSRFAGRVILQSLVQNFRPRENVIVYGAGDSGTQLVISLQNGNQYMPVAFVDDSRSMVDSIIHGIRVYGPNSLYQLVETYSVRQVLLAIPSATHAERKEILNRLEHLPVHVRTIPDMFDLVSGKVRVDEVRDIDIRDLLGRDIVPPDPELMGTCIRNKSVMVTGAAGSIGSELCREIVNISPVRLVLVDSFEFGLHALERELIEKLAAIDGGADIEIVTLLGSVCNSVQMEAAIRDWDIDTVYHAAAYKQVPMVEKNVAEGTRNNVIGTLVSALAAEKNKVRNFVFISTDKAVRPTNYMGATKRFAEQILQAMAERGSETKYSIVRFGNVLGSSGSVVPLFREQINNGGPVEVTHPEIIRYFMTVQEAAQLVIQASSMAVGGDVFILDMDKPIRIVDLARKMIHLMGFDVKDENSGRGDIEIRFIGLRPGEKLYEELLIDGSEIGTEHPKIMRAEEKTLEWRVIQAMVSRLRAACERADTAGIRAVLMEAVGGFRPETDAPDAAAPRERRAESAAADSRKVTPLFRD